jgi:hypothetical protein
MPRPRTKGQIVLSPTAAGRDPLSEIVVGLANETNRLANGYDVPVDDRFLQM